MPPRGEPGGDNKAQCWEIQLGVRPPSGGVEYPADFFAAAKSRLSRLHQGGLLDFFLLCDMGEFLGWRVWVHTRARIRGATLENHIMHTQPFVCLAGQSAHMSEGDFVRAVRQRYEDTRLINPRVFTDDNFFTECSSSVEGLYSVPIMLPTEPLALWIHGSPGNGKTSEATARLRLYGRGAYGQKNIATKWADGLHRLQWLVDDHPVASSVGDASEWADRLKQYGHRWICHVEIKGGHIDVNPTHIIVTSNHSMKAAYANAHCEPISHS